MSEQLAVMIHSSTWSFTIAAVTIWSALDLTVVFHCAAVAYVE